MSSLSQLRAAIHQDIDAFDFAAANPTAIFSTVNGSKPSTVPGPKSNLFPQYRQLLHAFCDFDISPLQNTASGFVPPNYNAVTAMMNYLDQTFVQRRHELFQVYMELDAFLLTGVHQMNSFCFSLGLQKNFQSLFCDQKIAADAPDTAVHRFKAQLNVTRCREILFPQNSVVNLII